MISRCRQIAPDQNTAIHGDFERIGHGAYRLLGASDNLEKFGEPGLKRTQSRIEKHGDRKCEVAGWRYEGDSVWHVKVGRQQNIRRNKYKVLSGMFEPEAASRAEQEAVLSLIAKWESELATIRSRPGYPPGPRFGRPTWSCPRLLARDLCVLSGSSVPKPSGFDTHHIVVAPDKE